MADGTLLCNEILVKDVPKASCEQVYRCSPSAGPPRRVDIGQVRLGCYVAVSSLKSATPRLYDEQAFGLRVLPHYLPSVVVVTWVPLDHTTFLSQRCQSTSLYCNDLQGGLLVIGSPVILCRPEEAGDIVEDLQDL